MASRPFREAMTPSSQAHTVEEVLADIMRAGASGDRADDVEEELAGLRARIRRVHETLKASRAPRPRVAVLERLDPVTAAARWVPDQVKRAGGIDVLAAIGTPTSGVTAGQVLAADPEIVIIAPSGAPLADAAAAGRALLARPEWRWLHARRTWAIESDLLTSHSGPKLVHGIEVMARLFNGALFTPLDGTHAERLA